MTFGDVTVDRVESCRTIVVGSGIAGLSTALMLDEATVLTEGELARDGSTALARGGIAAALGMEDSCEQHARDTLAVSGGLALPGMVGLLTAAAPERIDWIVKAGARFDRTPEGALRLGREAGHHRRRIVHAQGDATGAEVARALAAAVRDKDTIRVVEGATALDLVRARGRVVGVLSRMADGETVLLLASAVVLATGGIGHLFACTTNPAGAVGGGLAMAARAGAHLADLEFMQFHPTAFAAGTDPLPLLTEALRGEGAVLVDAEGYRFMTKEHLDAELAPRDVIARTIFRCVQAKRKVFLDATAVGPDLAERFPSVCGLAQAIGLDARVDPLPVTPAAHYFMGGVVVDADGRTTLPGLWAVGEVSTTGVHGANRLASNSLVEGMVFGHRAAVDINRSAGASALHSSVEVPCRSPFTDRTDGSIGEDLRQVMWQRVGVLRDEAGLRRAVAQFRRWMAEVTDGSRLYDQLLVARLVAESAMARRESRGAHFRTDFRQTNQILTRRRVITPAAVATESLAVDRSRRRGTVTA